MTSTLDVTERIPPGGAKPIIAGRRHAWSQFAVYVFVLVPMIALVAAVPLAWGWGLTWLDVVLAVAFFYLSGLGVTIGYHRYFTHSSFKAKRWLRVVLALCGSMAVQGPPIIWVADHRRHHAFSDRDGDPHSPWRYGSSFRGLTKGLFHAHIGWLFDVEQTDQKRFAPDLRISIL